MNSSRAASPAPSSTWSVSSVTIRTTPAHDDRNAHPSTHRPSMVPPPDVEVDGFDTEDGNLLIQTGHTIHRVHWFIFRRHSAWFCELYEAQRHNSNTPIVLEGVDTNDLLSLLAILYPQKLTSHSLTTKDEWTSVLRITHEFRFESARELAIIMLHPLASPLDRIVLGRRYDIFHWLLDAYLAICQRSDVLTLEEGEQLGMADVIAITHARHELALRSTTPDEARYLVWRICCEVVDVPDLMNLHREKMREGKLAAGDPVKRAQQAAVKRRAEVDAARSRMHAAETALREAEEELHLTQGRTDTPPATSEPSSQPPSHLSVPFTSPVCRIRPIPSRESLRNRPFIPSANLPVDGDLDDPSAQDPEPNVTTEKCIAREEGDTPSDATFTSQQLQLQTSSNPRDDLLDDDDEATEIEQDPPEIPSVEKDIAQDPTPSLGESEIPSGNTDEHTELRSLAAESDYRLHAEAANVRDVAESIGVCYEVRSPSADRASSPNQIASTASGVVINASDARFTYEHFEHPAFVLGSSSSVHPSYFVTAPDGDLTTTASEWLDGTSGFDPDYGSPSMGHHEADYFFSAMDSPNDTFFIDSMGRSLTPIQEDDAESPLASRSRHVSRSRPSSHAGSMRVRHQRHQVPQEPPELVEQRNELHAQLASTTADLQRAEQAAVDALENAFSLSQAADEADADLQRFRSTLADDDVARRRVDELRQKALGYRQKVADALMKAHGAEAACKTAREVITRIESLLAGLDTEGQTDLQVAMLDDESPTPTKTQPCHELHHFDSHIASAPSFGRTASTASTCVDSASEAELLNSPPPVMSPPLSKRAAKKKRKAARQAVQALTVKIS